MARESAVILLVDVAWMPPADDFDGLMARRLQTWTSAADVLGPRLRRFIAYADRAQEIAVSQLTGLRDISLQDLEAAGLFSYRYGANMADGLTVALDACTEEGINRILLVASSVPNTILNDTGLLVQSFPPSALQLDATLAAGKRCGAAGVRVDTVAIDGFSEALESPMLTQFLADLAAATGSASFTLRPHSSLTDFERKVTTWFP